MSTWKVLCYYSDVVKRSYQQFCGLAAALDVVGERWALLIVRDLAPGPRRFTDLFDGLPGIATDVLADRLRSLESAGAVERVDLKHPAPARLYGLTERGKELARIAGELAGWGLPLLAGESVRTHRRNPAWALQMVARSYRGGLPDGEYRWSIGGQHLRIVLLDGRATMAYGHGDGTALVTVTCSDADFFALLGRRQETRLSEGVHVDGMSAEEADVVLGELVSGMPRSPARRR